MVSETHWADAGTPRFEFDRITLRFRDPATEAMFQRDTLAQTIHFTRAFQIAGILIYIAFGLLDVIVGGPSRVIVLSIRIFLVTPILFGVLLLTYRRDFYRIMQPSLALAML